MLTRRGALALFGGSIVFAVSRRAHATEVPRDLMNRLASHAAAFEQLKTHASFAYEAEVETLDSSGTPTSVKAANGNVVADGKKARVQIAKYVDDGVEQTADARHFVAQNDAGPFVRMPFHALEQPFYDFDVLERSVGEGAPPRARIAFTPNAKSAGRVTISGSAWVDTNKGTVVTSRFVPSGSFPMVERMEVDVVFGATTALCPAVSKTAIEGRAIRTLGHIGFRGHAIFSGYKLVP